MEILIPALKQVLTILPSNMMLTVSSITSGIVSFLVFITPVVSFVNTCLSRQDHTKISGLTLLSKREEVEKDKFWSSHRDPVVNELD